MGGGDRACTHTPWYAQIPWSQCLVQVLGSPSGLPTGYELWGQHIPCGQCHQPIGGGHQETVGLGWTLRTLRGALWHSEDPGRRC